ncbi:hypothetical protein NMY22_g19468 [Coprinellus aureogranulatus]|nr:hypothetical protein NMY22_g19468 [Coprinellus aureogranulatus]
MGGREHDEAAQLEAELGIRHEPSIAGVFSGAWQVHSKGYTVTVKSKPWWGETCQAAYDEYREDNSPETRRAFWAAVKAAKREFFDEKVTEISVDHKRPWDLMVWIQERKNPPCKAIQFNGQPCHTTDQLWQALHGTYNAANNRPVDLSILDDLPTLAAREWPEFSELELRQALEACSSCSAPGPDHVTWRHLKAILSIPDCTVLILRLANACIDVGHWPEDFTVPHFSNWTPVESTVVQLEWLEFLAEIWVRSSLAYSNQLQPTSQILKIGLQLE